jgi:hypothetical protein
LQASGVMAESRKFSKNLRPELSILRLYCSWAILSSVPAALAGAQSLFLETFCRRMQGDTPDFPAAALRAELFNCLVRVDIAHT